jgi:hypothetical protein
MDALFLGKDSPRAASGLFKKRQTTLILVGDYTGWKASKLACMNHASLSLEIKKRTITIMGLITSLESAPRKALSCNHLFTYACRKLAYAHRSLLTRTTPFLIVEGHQSNQNVTSIHSQQHSNKAILLA